MSNKTQFLTFIKSKVAELETVAYYFAIFQVRLFAYQKACISVENILKAVLFRTAVWPLGDTKYFFFKQYPPEEKLNFMEDPNKLQPLQFIFLKRFLKISMNSTGTLILLLINSSKQKWYYSPFRFHKIIMLFSQLSNPQICLHNNLTSLVEILHFK